MEKKHRRWTSGLVLVLLAFVGAMAPGIPSDADVEDPGWGFGQWINITEGECEDLFRVCAEFVDDLSSSPYTGRFCCIDRSEVRLGRYDSCDKPFFQDPREDSEDP